MAIDCLGAVLIVFLVVGAVVLMNNIVNKMEPKGRDRPDWWYGAIDQPTGGQGQVPYATKRTPAYGSDDLIADMKREQARNAKLRQELGEDFSRWVGYRAGIEFDEKLAQWQKDHPKKAGLLGDGIIDGEWWDSPTGRQ